MMRFYVGLDLGRREDYTALCVLERREDASYVRYECRHLARYDLGTPYLRIVDAVGELLGRQPLTGRCQLVIDASGVGDAVCEMFSAAGRRYASVLITGGFGWHREGGRRYIVSKHALVSVVQKFLSCEALGVSKQLAEAETLRAELRHFRVRISKAANELYEAREGQHDDLVLSLAVALFVGEHPGGRFAPVGT